MSSTIPISFFDKVPPPVMRQTDPRLSFINLPFFTLLSKYTHDKNHMIHEELDRRIRFIISTQSNKFDTAISTSSDEKDQLTTQWNNINKALQKYDTVDLDINELVNVVAVNAIN